MTYKFREDISLADVAFDASADTLEKLFIDAAMAVENTMVHNVKSIESKKTVKIKTKAENEEKLLHNFLEELVFYKDAKLLVFGKFNVKIAFNKKNKIFQLNAILHGEKINPKKHNMLVDVKSVTWHQFSLKKIGSKWKATVVLDV